MTTLLDEKPGNSLSVDLQDEQWREYLTDNNPMINNVEGNLRQLTESRTKLFSSANKMHVDIVDILGKATCS
jgi:hypothetical protein